MSRFEEALLNATAQTCYSRPYVSSLSAAVSVAPDVCTRVPLKGEMTVISDRLPRRSSGPAAPTQGSSMRDGDWVTLPYAEFQELVARVERAERFLGDRPTLAQDFEELRRRAQIAEAARDSAQAEAARLRAALAVAPSPGSVLWQARLLGRMIDALFERFTPQGVDVQLHRCRVCELVSVDRDSPNVLDHDASCLVRQILQEWSLAGDQTG
jgi:hypothetical protein